ncbi:SLC13 family permease [Aegicerativicinus sediminis]|uniref:SLC13 family permease n=1 Tax=Aegicerativicinus sediminis TaxID=2893202 RepID=UPI001E445921|nr:SLC13 family permease [Aegicerativicinus sediminis]
MTTIIIILFLTIALFVWNKFPPDIVALISMLSLYLFGILDLTETLSGFSNPTVIMIASLFVVGEGLSRTGWTALAGRKFVRWAKNNVPKLLVIVTLGSSLLSGFVSNTGTVAAFLPVTVNAAWNAGTLPSKLLMPVAFGSNTGGLLTLTGTPPNIIASNALIQQGFEGFSFFEFSLIGIPLLIIALLYFRYFGYKLLPNNKTNNKPLNIENELYKWIDHYSIGDDLYRLRVRSMSPFINTAIGDWNFEEEHNVSVVRLKRRHFKPIIGEKQFVELPEGDTVMHYHDIITVKGKSEDVDRLMRKFSLGLIPYKAEMDSIKSEFINQEIGLAEMLITPNSVFVGQTLPLGHYLEKSNVQLIAASRANRPISGNIHIEAGDAFIIRGSWENIDELQSRYENVVISGNPEDMSKNVDTITAKSYIALGTLILMVLLLVLNIMPGAITALICAGIMMITGCVPITKAYKGISWTSVIMIAAMIPMGIALQKTGLAQAAADSLVNSLGKISPTFMLAGVFLVTTAFSQTINNSATTVLMAPIAIVAAVSLGVNPQPFLMTVAISASTAFLTPIGTTTNAMVMAAGGYKFIDYVRVGGPLLLIFFITTLLIVPLFWSF